MKKAKTVKSTEVPVTQKMLYLVRDELKTDIKSLEFKMDSKFEKVSSEIHQLKILIEEQNARNIFVTSLFHRQDRVEKRLDEVTKQFDLKISRKP